MPTERAGLGELRCDLHPRASNDGRRVAFDSVHDGDGRQVYLVDVGEILDGAAAGAVG